MKPNNANPSIKEPKKHYAFEVIVAISLFLVFLLVIATGLLSYVRLDQIIQTVNNSIRPDQKLILVKEIYNDLSEAESSVKSYSLTRNEEDMDRFYTLIEVTGERIEELKSMCSRSDPMYPYILTLDSIVIRKFMNLDRFLSIQDEYRVQQAMDRVMEQIRKEKKPELPPVSDTVVISNADTLKKESFFSRIFRRNKQPEQQQPDTVLITTKQLPAASYDDINDQVSKVQQEAMAREKMLRQEEWGLLQQDHLLMDQIRKVLSRMESVEKETLSGRTRDTERKAGEVKQIIFAFGVSASLLLLLAGLVIFRYVRKNALYQKALRRARDEAEDLSRTKERFYANMSHEIRTPMNVISGFVAQLLKSRLDAGQHEQLMMVKKSSDHLLGILNDLLDLSKLQAGKLELAQTTFSIREIMDDMKRWFEPAAMDKNIRLNAWVGPGVPQFVTGDPIRLRQILFNLTGNAIKFTEKGEISIKAFPREITDDKTLVVFEVKDTGIGIKPEELKKIFNEFEQGSGTQRQNSGGTGLGLAITRKLIELHGGSLKVESELGAGSSFSVSIPYLKAKGAGVPVEEKKTTATESLDGLQVLLVDDEEYNVKLLKVILERYGCKTVEARSGEDALRIMGQSDIDLILMDLHLPGISGDETAREIRRMTGERGVPVPIIIISAAVTAESRDIFREMGIDDCITKPFEEEQLIQVIHKYISRISDRKIKEIVPEIQPGQAKPPEREDVPVYDLSPLRDTSAGDDLFFSEMVQLFILDTDQGLEEITDCLAQQEWLKAAEIIHKISAPCRHLKAEKLYRLLKEAEALLNDPDKYWMSAEVILQAVEEFERIRSDLESRNEIK
ncbi:MAG: response regulator [Lentimicrobiaceae bacterium]|nr:response regulator [Lentimicrobiaceae bacterium]